MNPSHVDLLVLEDEALDYAMSIEGTPNFHLREVMVVYWIAQFLFCSDSLSLVIGRWLFQKPSQPLKVSPPLHLPKQVGENVLFSHVCLYGRMCRRW